MGVAHHLLVDVMAEGGGTEPYRLSEAIEASYGVIEKMLG